MKLKMIFLLIVVSLLVGGTILIWHCDVPLAIEASTTECKPVIALLLFAAIAGFNPFGI